MKLYNTRQASKYLKSYDLNLETLIKEGKIHPDSEEPVFTQETLDSAILAHVSEYLENNPDYVPRHKR